LGDSNIQGKLLSNLFLANEKAEFLMKTNQESGKPGEQGKLFDV
jgi:hypothetical protein